MEKDIRKLAQEYPGVILQIRAEELMDCINSIFNDFCAEHERIVREKHEEKFFTREEVAEMLRRDKSTISRWKKSGYLVPVEVGGVDLYSKKDIDKLLAPKPPQGAYAK